MYIYIYIPWGELGRAEEVACGWHAENSLLWGPARFSLTKRAWRWWHAVYRPAPGRGLSLLCLTGEGGLSRWHAKRLMEEADKGAVWPGGGLGVSTL